MAPKKWFIHDNGVQGPEHRVQLIGCSVWLDGNIYEFRGPAPDFEVQAVAITQPNTPFYFPKFTSKLHGTTPRDWYIKVSAVDTGSPMDLTEGFWSNSEFPAGKVGPGEDDNDTWTAQAGHGTGTGDETEKDKDKEKEAAASASPKL